MGFEMEKEINGLKREYLTDFLKILGYAHKNKHKCTN